MINNTSEPVLSKRQIELLEAHRTLNVSQNQLQQMAEKALSDAETKLPGASGAVVAVASLDGYRLGVFGNMKMGDRYVWSWGGYLEGDYKGNLGAAVETRLVWR